MNRLYEYLEQIKIGKTFKNEDELLKMSLLSLKKYFLNIENELTSSLNQDDPVMDINDLKKKTKEQMINDILNICKEYKEAEKKGYI